MLDRHLQRYVRLALALLWGALLGMAPAQAHLMAAQKGTLNIAGNAAFLVLSVPVSALRGIDDDGDGALSKAELASHGDAIRSQVQAGVQLLGADGALPLQLMMLDIAPAENAPTAAASHLVVLGRFQLSPAAGGSGVPDTVVSDGLSLRFGLFGTGAGEQQQDITITRQQESQWLRFSPKEVQKMVLPGSGAVLAEYIYIGTVHVLSGADHLLFLLVVLSVGWRWRTLLAVLSCFTVGHALTLAICIWGGWSAPERMVEPAIAATIVGMAAFDRWAAWHAKPLHAGVRLALVFVCALIHGLGLASALGDLTQWAPGSKQLILALAGFNVGIELAQIAVAAVCGGVVFALSRVLGQTARLRIGKIGPALAMCAGAFWFVERVAAAASA